MQFKNYQKDLVVILGSTIYAASVNLFAMPAHIYTGGIVGTAQLIRTLIINATGFNPGFDFAGLINLCLNIPLFLLAFKSLNKKFAFMTLTSIATQTVVMTLVKVPSSPLVDDTIAQLILAGVTTGFGCGLVLLMKACSGGIDIIGVWLSQNKKKVTVGSISIIYNTVFYSLCALIFDIQTSIYSIIYVVVFGIAMDKVHYQNIDVQVMVFSKHPEKIKKTIMEQYVRGVTCWSGKGAYTNEDTEVFITICSKYEVNEIRRMVKENDPKAFVITNENIEVRGNVEKRLV